MDEQGSAVVMGAVRAADTDRDGVVAQLSRAHVEGRIDLHEFDERVQQVWAARTYDDLRCVTADLPAERVHERYDERHGRPHDQRGAVAAWLTASLLNVLIWAVVCLATASWVYPWWVWVAGPWGAVLLAGAVGGSVCRRR